MSTHLMLVTGERVKLIRPADADLRTPDEWVEVETLEHHQEDRKRWWVSVHHVVGFREIKRRAS